MKYSEMIDQLEDCKDHFETTDPEIVLLDGPKTIAIKELATCSDGNILVIPVASASQWIPVGQRLPESGFYLTFDTYSESMPIKMNRFNSPYWTMNHSTVTHWCELPTPPKDKAK